MWLVSKIPTLVVSVKVYVPLIEVIFHILIHLNVLELV